MVQCENFLSTFPYGSMLKLCPAMVAILDFNQQKNPHIEMPVKNQLQGMLAVF
jgi:hypothetical protein